VGSVFARGACLPVAKREVSDNGGVYAVTLWHITDFLAAVEDPAAMRAALVAQTATRLFDEAAGDAISEQHSGLFLGFPAVTIRGKTTAGSHLYYISQIVFIDSQGRLFSLVAPAPEPIDPHPDTFLKSFTLNLP
jgi:hypothetical protein